MNNSKMWLVVKPTVGIPLFLSAVAIGSFAVHVAVVTNTSWVRDFLQGQPLGSGDQLSLAVPGPSEGAAKAAAAFEGGGEIVKIVLPDGTVTTATIADAETLALADARTRPPVTH